VARSTEGQDFDLRQIIKQIYRMTPSEQHINVEDLKWARYRVYRETLAEEARRLGCQGAAQRARPPSGESLRKIDLQCEEDAANITNTWNEAVERQVDRLYAQNPRGNRHFYAKHMEAWAKERDVWKWAQVSLNTVSTAQQLAQADFVRFNGLTGARYWMAGPAPVEEECRQLMALGEVTQEVVDANPCPIHINCPHEWVIARASIKGQVSCKNLWVG